MNILIGSLSTLGESHAKALFRLRHRVFKHRLDWKVVSVAGEERDVFDDAHAAYVLGCDAQGGLEGCLRLLPTVRPYMLETVFPFLLDDAVAPRARGVWELSRFALDGTAAGTCRGGFSQRALDLVRGAVEFARLHAIDRYVLATSVAIERMIARQGLHCHRLGAPRRIGPVESVALALEIDTVTLRALDRGAAVGAQPAPDALSRSGPPACGAPSPAVRPAPLPSCTPSCTPDHASTLTHSHASPRTPSHRLRGSRHPARAAVAHAGAQP